jgi:hypothetical protein
MILGHAERVLFAWIFGNQAAVPVPVVHALVDAGALAAFSVDRLIHPW